MNFPKLYTACLVLNDFHGGDHQTFLSDSELRECVKSKKHLRVGSSKSYLKLDQVNCAKVKYSHYIVYLKMFIPPKIPNSEPTNPTTINILEKNDKIIRSPGFAKS